MYKYRNIYIYIYIYILYPHDSYLLFLLRLVKQLLVGEGQSVQACAPSEDTITLATPGDLGKGSTHGSLYFFDTLLYSTIYTM